MLTTLLVWSGLIVLTIMSVHHVVTPLPVSVRGKNIPIIVLRTNPCNERHSGSVMLKLPEMMHGPNPWT